MRVVFALLTLLATARSGRKFGVVPGGQLGGAVVSGLVDDWGFTDAVSRAQLGTRPDDPYSVHVYGVHSGGDFYVASQGWRQFVGSGGDAHWVGYIAADPRVRLRIGEALYELNAVRVEEKAEANTVRQLFQMKYGSDADNWRFWRKEPHWVFRLESR
jgi:hypothetical protein